MFSLLVQNDKRCSVETLQGEQTIPDAISQWCTIPSLQRYLQFLSLVTFTDNVDNLSSLSYENVGVRPVPAYVILIRSVSLCVIDEVKCN